MRNILTLLTCLALAFGLSSCSKFKRYDGPEVTRVVVMKSSRMMYLMHHDEALTSYKIDLGFAPTGHKEFEGDGKTPEGRYTIDRRNPNSDFHLSIGIDYPNEKDIEHARKAGKEPGGDIFIHGAQKRGKGNGDSDWTWGCISVTNKEIEEIYAMVQDGTPIDIFP